MSHFQLRKLSLQPNQKSHKLAMIGIAAFVLVGSLASTLFIPLYQFFAAYSVMPIVSITFSYIQLYMDIFMLQFTFACFLVQVRFKHLASALT